MLLLLIGIKNPRNMAKTNPAYLIAMVAIIALASYAGVFDGILGDRDAPESELIYPSDKETTITLNTGDELATTATDATVKWYLFDSSGAYLKTGTTSSGTSSFNVPVSASYDLIIYYDEAGGNDFLPKEISFTTASEPTQTVNVDLRKESAATIDKVRDPVDLDTNVSVGAGQTVSFDLLISATTSNAALNNPIVVMNANSTSVESIKITGLAKVDCPDRLSEATDRNLYCYKDTRQIIASDGIVTYTGSLKMDDSSAAVDGDVVNFTIIDEGMYIESDYRTAGKSAFMYGAEDPVDDSDVAAADSSTSSLTLKV